ncbi:hypothetical protein GGX14DRAFT_558269 [Mycena pura]|uniref:Uncharacterized protein n=1 Tax=Mycena pura TaxID=153505 RepID=A0AAD6VW77_9AGAR|nr:hypothetical protein GGX14DRAFT_558269 [Mycena pura]
MSHGSVVNAHEFPGTFSAFYCKSISFTQHSARPLTHRNACAPPHQRVGTGTGALPTHSAPAPIAHPHTHRACSSTPPPLGPTPADVLLPPAHAPAQGANAYPRAPPCLAPTDLVPHALMLAPGSGAIGAMCACARSLASGVGAWTHVLHPPTRLPYPHASTPRRPDARPRRTIRRDREQVHADVLPPLASDPPLACPAPELTL